jgi:Ca2+-transporting ATPase
MTDWSMITTSEAAMKLQVDLQRGLASDEVKRRQAEHGYNVLPDKKGPSLAVMFLAQFREFLVLLLIGAAAVAILVGEVKDAVIISVVVVINAVLGVIQEYKADKALAALKLLSAPTAKVIRDGNIVELSARELVPGDLILLDAGDFVAADARLLESANLMADESALTGESVPVEKDHSFIASEPVLLADQRNIVHMGTLTTFGRGKALVTATGMETAIGQIAGLILKGEEGQTPLQKKLAQLGKQLGIFALLVCALIFIIGVARGVDMFQMFLTSISLAVAAIPEGLPAIVTIVLALGVQRMARQKAIVRKLPAVEILGAATVICSDKTGTLTQNKMTVRQVVTGQGSYTVTGEGFDIAGDFRRGCRPVQTAGEPQLALLLAAALLANDARLNEIEGANEVVGDPTEGALIVAAAKGGLRRDEMAAALPRTWEYPFDSGRKRMSTVHRGRLPVLIEGLPPEGSWLFSKGAPDLLLERCRYRLNEAGLELFSAEQKEEVLAQNRAMAGQALRVLGLALRPLENGSPPPLEEAESNLIFVGLAGMMDPPRPEAKEAIGICRQAGISVKMITGDHRDTALAIARELELATGEREIITGEELDNISQADLESRAGNLAVFARVSPEHKVRIVEALRANGGIVAMTGDGVNDAPALKKADIGIAMGKTGTVVAREASDMVLADDNFATIVKAVRDGRTIFQNIKKAAFSLLTCNLGEILVILTAILFGWPLPLLPIHILWINLVTDSLPSLALGVEPAEKNVMDIPPRNPAIGLFDDGIKRALLGFGIFVGAITLVAFNIGAAESLAKGQTMAFVTLSFSQLAHVFNCRSLSRSVFAIGFFRNRPLMIAVIISLALQLSVMITPFLMGAFRVVPLAAIDWLIVAALGASPLLLGELWKMVAVPSKKGRSKRSSQ